VTDSIWTLIGTGSFSSIWYWVFLGILWSHVMQAPFGVPVDLVRRAQGGDQVAAADLRALTGVRLTDAERLAAMAPWRAGGWSFALALLAGLGLGYGSELAQAALALAAPLALVRWLEARAAAAMADVPDMPALIRAHTVLRRKVQGIGIAAVFLTSVFGMLRLLADQAF
jgi:hypothetical protein